ncbi:hypothetical protein WN51_06166 [Melipona quadrifasciata]|uniref:Uncharacterized protein n=1 Tax=Melipona quadrifasciata TaxID=166423 RepID=A0A0M8ZTB5_9HYME|nr:hypothetical protein WN51_06166 [Melipona quadrifasciata]
MSIPYAPIAETKPIFVKFFFYLGCSRLHNLINFLSRHEGKTFSRKNGNAVSQSFDIADAWVLTATLCFWIRVPYSQYKHGSLCALLTKK